MVIDDSEFYQTLQLLLDIPPMPEEGQLDNESASPGSESANAKKRKLMTILKSGKLAIARTLRSSPEDSPTRYINAYVLAYNSHDLEEYKSVFLSLCTPEIRMINRVYGKVDPATGKPRNPFGDYSFLEMNGTQEVLYMAERFFNAVPDGIMETGSHRSANASKGTVHVTTYKFRGTLIEETPSIELDHSLLPSSSSSASPALSVSTSQNPSTPDLHAIFSKVQKHSLSSSWSYADFEESSPCQGAGFFRTRSVTNVGSLAMYVTEEGKISTVEFFYEFL